MSGLAIGKYIKHMLSGVTTNISPHFSTDVTPLIAYERTGHEIDAENSSYDGLAYVTSVRIDLVYNNYDDAVDAAIQVKSLLENKSGQYKNIVVHDCTFDGAIENTDGNLFQQTLNFDFKTD
ncbi:MAG TPA: hypothetical protein VK179_19545 [Bacteroidales bacterium]|nr:hypothetical protein [Bacteroidales bacterium]